MINQLQEWRNFIHLNRQFLTPHSEQCVVDSVKTVNVISGLFVYFNSTHLHDPAPFWLQNTSLVIPPVNQTIILHPRAIQIVAWQRPIPSNSGGFILFMSLKNTNQQSDLHRDFEMTVSQCLGNWKIDKLTNDTVARPDRHHWMTRVGSAVGV